MIVGEGTEKLLEPGQQGVCSEVMYPKNVRSCVNNITTAWLPKCEFSKDNTNRHSNVGGENPMKPQPNSKIYRLLRNTEQCRNSLPQGIAHKSAILIPND